jgi:N,N'-diacetyllegionaminate synthase
MQIKFIAEFCQNHNGNRKILQEMIHQAAVAGATYGKIQTIFASDLSKRKRFEDGLERDGKVLSIKRPFQAEYDRLKKLELTFDDQLWFIEECKRIGLIPLTTCFTRGHVERLATMGWREIKVASYDCASTPLIKELANKFDHLIISTGATYDSEISNTARVLNDIQKSFTYLHCITLYPTPLDVMNLSRIKYLTQYTSSVGFSNHANSAKDGVKADLCAIYLGATYVERHFTVLDADETRDGIVSINSSQLSEIIQFSKLARDDQKAYIEENIPEFVSMIGNEIRELSEQELLNRDYYRGRFTTYIGDRIIDNWDENC